MKELAGPWSIEHVQGIVVSSLGKVSTLCNSIDGAAGVLIRVQVHAAKFKVPSYRSQRKVKVTYSKRLKQGCF